MWLAMHCIVACYNIQLDYCLEKQMWQDVAIFKSFSDNKPSDSLTDSITEAFMKVSKNCTQKSFKKRCSIDEVF